METITFSTRNPPIKARNIQDFPAPFLPSNPVTIPVEEVMYPPDRTVFCPKRTTTLSTINLCLSIEHQGDGHQNEKQKKIREQYNDLEMPAGEAQINIEEAGIP